jgi:multidrug resistance efflux pump
MATRSDLRARLEQQLAALRDLEAAAREAQSRIGDAVDAEPDADEDDGQQMHATAEAELRRLEEIMQRMLGKSGGAREVKADGGDLGAMLARARALAQSASLPESDQSELEWLINDIEDAVATPDLYDLADLEQRLAGFERESTNNKSADPVAAKGASAHLLYG